MKIKVNSTGAVEIETEEAPATTRLVIGVDADQGATVSDTSFEEALAAYNKGEDLVVHYHTYPGLDRTFVLPLKYIDAMDGKIIEFRFRKDIFESYQTGRIVRVMEFILGADGFTDMSDWSWPIADSGAPTNNLQPVGGDID